MALAARCPNCQALFRIAADQLKLRGGLVRCGACQQVFDATGTLNYIDDALLSPSAPPPAVGAVIAAIRKAEATVGDASSLQEAEVLPPPAAFAAAETGLPSPESLPIAAPVEATAPPQESPALPATEPALTSASIDSSGSAAPPPSAAAGSLGRVADNAAVTTDAPGLEAAPPAFLREAPAPGRRRSRALLGAGAALLAIVALAQIAVALRAEIVAQFPQARPALNQLCRVFRCTVSWPARGELLAVVGSELQAIPGTGAFELAAVVRNRGSMTLALPAIELTLSDTLNRTVARRVFTPLDYLAAESEPQALLQGGLEAGADVTIRIAFEARGLNAAGFFVYPFYP